MRGVGQVALCLVALAGGCRRDPYLSASPPDVAAFKRVRLPFPARTHFRISQGAFGRFPGLLRDLLVPEGARTHTGPGQEYQWDFDVPFGTEVSAVDNGVVTSVWRPSRGSRCNDPAYNDAAHLLRVRHADGTVAVYVHVESRVSVGDLVTAGQVVGLTGDSGNLCTPQLHFGIFEEGDRSIPLRFIDLPGERAEPGFSGAVP